ncbi:MAG: hypothetical protein MR804_07100, partial [Limosilactobacillus reuteri]|nr:hypothetical protein [Limosilactobacillus reuteri]
LGKLIAQAGTKLIEKGKIRTIISGKSKIMVRILIFRGRNLIVNSQPHKIPPELISNSGGTRHVSH